MFGGNTYKVDFHQNLKTVKIIKGGSKCSQIWFKPIPPEKPSFIKAMQEVI